MSSITTHGHHSHGEHAFRPSKRGTPHDRSRRITGVFHEVVVVLAGMTGGMPARPRPICPRNRVIRMLTISIDGWVASPAEPQCPRTLPQRSPRHDL